MAAEIVHDDDVAGPERRKEDLLDIEAETVAVDWPLEKPWRLDAVMARRPGRSWSSSGRVEPWR
jgi:hypothetical protein